MVISFGTVIYFHISMIHMLNTLDPHLSIPNILGIMLNTAYNHNNAARLE